MQVSTMEIHEVATLFPEMSEEEFSALVQDIKANGLLEPIWTHEQKIIDGRNRYKACQQLGITPKYRAWDGRGSLVQFVVSLNLKRRHLSSSQKAVLALEVERLLSEEVEAARREKISHFRQTGETPQKIAESPIEARQQAAETVGTNRQYVSDAKQIERKAPELLPIVRKGTLSIPDAKNLAQQPPAIRRDIMERVEAGRSKNVREAVKEVAREQRVEKIQSISEGNTPIAPTLGKFPVIYADPPWQYEHSKTDNRAIENHYPTMTLDEICKLPIGDISTDDAVLLMWATSPKLAEAMRVIASWGFAYRTSMVWVKDKIGMGYYARQRHELLLIATKGNLPVPEPENRPDSVIESPRNEHSAKPLVFYDLIERMYPEYKKVELFCRSPREGWAVWGNQASV